MQVTTALLDTYLGKNINAICPAHYKAENHCAHFVSHVLNLRFGALCHAKTGVNIRVQELFAKCQKIEQLIECRSIAVPQLVFITGEHNVNMQRHEMVNVPKKHVGIASGPFVWHYSNLQQRAVKETLDKFLNHYPKQYNGLWLGSIPVGAMPAPFPAGTP